MSRASLDRVRTALGCVSLACVPTVFAAVVISPLAVVLGLEVNVFLALAGITGLVTAAFIGPRLVDRHIASLPHADSESDLSSLARTRVDVIATELGLERPAVTVIKANAANVALVTGRQGPRLVVTTRLLSGDPAIRDAALHHAVARMRTREAAFTTAMLPGLLAVEMAALVATLLVWRTPERRDTDRRVNRIHGYEPETKRVPRAVYRLCGLVLWLGLVPVWLPAAVGDRLFVAGRTRAADGEVAAAGRRQGLAEALAFTNGATGASEWSPLLDRLSLVPMADATTARVRGTGRHETRQRLARLRSKRRL